MLIDVTARNRLRRPCQARGHRRVVPRRDRSGSERHHHDNQGARRTSATPPGGVGRLVTMLIPEDRQRRGRHLTNPRGERADHFESVRQRKDGRPGYLADDLACQRPRGRSSGIKIARDHRARAWSACARHHGDEYRRDVAHEPRSPRRSQRLPDPKLRFDADTPTVHRRGDSDRQVLHMIRQVDDLDVSRGSRQDRVRRE